jgi:hypothetical protein
MELVKVSQTGWKVVDWMHVTQDKDQLRALVNTVMNLQVLKRRGTT